MEITTKENLKGRFYVEITTENNAVFKTMSFSKRNDAEKYGIEFLNTFSVVESWVNVSTQEPPPNTDIIAEDPEGNIYLTQWRKSYGVFMCQSKSESSFDWQWKKV